jgi:hypothetical protein
MRRAVAAAGRCLEGGDAHRARLPGLDSNVGKDGWHGKLVCDDFSGYNACFELGVIEVGCLAHARRKFHELWANHGSQAGEWALKFFGKLYDTEREVRDLKPDERRRIRQARSDKVVKALGDVPPIVATGGGAVHVTRPLSPRQRELASRAGPRRLSVSTSP